MKPVMDAGTMRDSNDCVSTISAVGSLLRSGIIITSIAVGWIAVPRIALADEGGVSFWIPGFFGSLAATPATPGWSVTEIFYHDSVSASGNVALAKAAQIGQIPVNLTATVNANVNANVNLGFVAATYVFATPVLGGQASASLLGAYGNNSTSLAGQITGTVTGPGGGTVPFPTLSDNINSSLTAFGDLVPQFALKWNSGVNNYMTYVTADLPAGAYQSTRLANLGIGHWAVDAGGGYTYFDQKTGHEFSAVLGFTYNFINPATQYQNGVDMHLDWGASQFLTKQWQVGLVGYVYQEVGCDSGSGDRLGCFQSRVLGVGPQVGYIFPISDKLQGYLNLKAYGEFDNANRPAGWNLWLTFNLSPAATPPTSSRPMFTK